MERKRKLPARAAARYDHVAKKRIATPPEPSPAPTSVPPPPEPVPEEPQPLPKSIQAGNPLPTVENPQPDDLSSKDYQSIQESGVLAESLSRSRQKWIHEGIFEKYWTKPTKRKGVVKEEPNNPPKDSMTKIGQVTITVEPHVLEATMYAVKDPKPAPSASSSFRPIVQYGPPNGVMPPPPKPSTPSTPTAPVASPLQAPAQPQSSSSSQAPTQPAQAQAQAQAQAPLGLPPSQVQQPDPHRPPSSATPSKTQPLTSPRGLESVLAAPQRSPAPMATPPQPNGPPQSTLSASRPLHAPSPTTTSSIPGPALPPSAKPATKPATPAAPGADPIIVTLAEKASEDPHLRDLMKRVAIGEASPPELAHFQRIIDQITIEYKKKGGQQGPSADRLLVDGRTVKYFADEVRTILDIVLASNSQQRSIDLRPPPGSDPLVILLLRKALDESNTRDIVRRVAEGKTRFADAPDLKHILDKLKDLVTKERAKTQPPTTGVAQATPPTSNAVETSNSSLNGALSRKLSLAGSSQSQNASASHSQQALRSKGPPPSTKPDISAIVLEFSGGTGDRYLFPKYSILEYSGGGSQAIASFLIVRRGSKLEYGGDPTLDYYQPVTIRLYSHSGKHLENLARAVAPQDEVRRYMDDIMDNMTRAEYVLLAMRLPRAEKEDQMDDRPATPKAELPNQPQQQQGVLWTAKASPAAPPKAMGKPTGEDEQYQSFIATVS